ncbi:hypothetical protein GCM10023201_04520 [Actinomycetospora corticicola]|uniref:Uncharacterized protein n=1 Tax=Actinomycetospora corticicola TaxID=663602 RepID=A0A7Y9J4C3_9PSEU|nr:hypothetical protein [Actinomycetospora corticicola]NYD34900.1 hypothetical protein [Actinomycetospora corticicola]
MTTTGRRLALDVEPAVNSTVVMMTVLALAIDRGVSDFRDVLSLSLGPLLATFAAHLFATTLKAVHAEHALPSRRRVLGLTGHAAQYLLPGLGPLAVVAVVAGTGFAGAAGPVESAHITIDLSWIALVVLGGVGGWRALRRWWGAVLGAVGAFGVGFVVLLLRVLLEGGFAT